MPWWVIMLVNVLLLINLALVTLPLYRWGGGEGRGGEGLAQHDSLQQVVWDESRGGGTRAVQHLQLPPDSSVVSPMLPERCSWLPHDKVALSSLLMSKILPAAASVAPHSHTRATLALHTHTHHSLTAHTLKVDKALLQSIVRDKLHEKACAELKKNSKPSSGGGAGASGGGSRSSSSKLSRTATFRNSLKRSFTSTRRNTTQQQVLALRDQAPVSDNKRWQQLQEAQSV